MWCTGGPPWPQLAIVVLLIAGARGPSILCVAAIAMACILATLHAKGLRQGSAQALASAETLLCGLHASAQVCLRCAQGLYNKVLYHAITPVDIA